MPIARSALSDGPNVSTAVVEAVAEAEGVSPTEMETPLHRAIDPEALNELFEPERSSPDDEFRVSFTYSGYDITVRGPEQVVVRRADEQHDRIA
jgi:hypothetical protein